ncbi:helix-turn-helix domain-containing protein [Rubellicoccus peritrichatus]|uniref:Helix-turn-helix domain-containing protein n=1 Tax=Rubellicoccus peritrichatus TaxID=3080537 RepID=A0AAQ3LB32_9BACT|nr:helix-turn-helix domain-containing protein [Puniceicoccus sp. CR14]WOO40660.1 helix-turn-helix domain-containing protein [Puniceicoccus sp. CR14]
MHKLTSISENVPRTIRQTLLTKLQLSAKLREIRADFEAMVGIRLRLVGPTHQGLEIQTPCSDSALCQRVRGLQSGRVHCQRYTEALVANSGQEQLACGECDAGLTGFCVPLRISGETIGYLLAGGYRLGELDLCRTNRLRHLMGRLGIPDEAALLQEYENETIEITREKHAAMQRWLQLAADSLIRSLELRDDACERPLPTFVTKICSIIQQNYRNPPSLSEAARICGLSEGYFCRAFHEFTGLRFVEYIHAVRIEQVCELIQDDRASITEAAFDAGFQSISQFNRVFRKLRGVSPRDWRREQLVLSQ